MPSMRPSPRFCLGAWLQLLAAGCAWASCSTGVLTYLPVSSLQEQGWVPCRFLPFSTAVTQEELSACADQAGPRGRVLVGAAELKEDILRVAAIGTANELKAQTTSTSTAELREHGTVYDAYWYNVPGKAFGFSGQANIAIEEGADSATSGCDLRLSWPFSDGPGAGLLNSAAGCTILNREVDREPFKEWARAIYTHTSSECIPGTQASSDSDDTGSDPRPWFLRSGATEMPFVITCVLNLVIMIVTTGLTWQYKKKEKEQKKERTEDTVTPDAERETEPVSKKSEEVTKIGQTAGTVMWAIYDFLFMCFRMDWLLNSPDARYEPWINGAGESMWLGSSFWSTNSSELEKYSCNFNMTGARPNTEADACGIIAVPLTAYMIDNSGASELRDWTELNSVKMTLGLGLILWVAIRAVLVAITWDYDPVGISFKTRLEEDEDIDEELKTLPTWVRTIFKFFYEFLINMLLSSQQSMVLLPLAGSVALSPYCAALTVPARVGELRTECIYKWSAVGLPYGLLFTLGGIWGASTFKSAVEQKDELVEKLGASAYFLMQLFGAVATVLLLFGGVVFLLFWELGGIIFGMYFSFNEVFMQDLGLIKLLGGPINQLVLAVVPASLFAFFRTQNPNAIAPS